MNKNNGLYKRKKYYHIDKVIEGKRICLSTEETTKKEAEKKLKEIQQEVENAFRYGIIKEYFLRDMLDLLKKESKDKLTINEITLIKKNVLNEKISMIKNNEDVFSLYNDKLKSKIEKKRFFFIVTKTIKKSYFNWINPITGLRYLNDKPFFINYSNPKSTEENNMNIKKIIGTQRNQNNIIYFGAPGTGKSYEIEKALKEDKTKNDFIFRTTFYEDYSYYDFVGQYKPVVYTLDKGQSSAFTRTFNERSEEIKTYNGKEPLIVYDFIPGVFVEACVKAFNNKGKEVFLIIEEINRGNASSIFGDFFQSLDRNKNGDSKYKIKLPRELSLFLQQNCIDKDTNNHEHFSLPSNLKIIATMNTSDQSLFKMDSAFKRRWAMKYSPIETNKIKDVKIEGTNILWANFLTQINYLILEKLNSEDKMIGQFFCHIDEETKIISASEFQDKVLHYLFFDVFRFDRDEIFKTESFSELYNKKPEDIFNIIKRDK